MKFQAPGKMILLGEYAVLEGAPALVTAVSLFATVEIEQLTGNVFYLSAPSLDLPELPFVLTPAGHVRFDPNLPPNIERKVGFFSRIFEFILAKSGQNPFTLSGLIIFIDTNAFYDSRLKSKLGFGSSAAFCAALTAGLSRVWKMSEKPASQFELALQAHHFAQGKMGSGIDVAASFFGGYLVYKGVSAGSLPRSVDACQGLFFKPVFTGRSASTRKLVGGVRQLKEKAPEQYKKWMERLKQLSAEGSQAFEEQQTKQFLDIVRAYYQALDGLGQASGVPIISEPHQRLFALAEEQKVFYKPSGAGSGDIGILFSDNEDALNAAAQAAQQAGFWPLDVRSGAPGLQVFD